MANVVQQTTGSRVYTGVRGTPYARKLLRNSAGRRVITLIGLSTCYRQMCTRTGVFDFFRAQRCTTYTPYTVTRTPRLANNATDTPWIYSPKRVAHQ
jgi:hypothetical protein